MAENILKEFLVRCGVQVDENGLRRLRQSLGTTTREAAALGGGMVAMATAVTAAVAITARRFDELYYASQRAAASAENLTRFRFAAQQVGIAAATFSAQAEGLASRLRDAPYIRAWITSVTGAAGDTTQMIQRLAEWYRQQMKAGQYQEMYARMMLQQWGIDSETIRQMAQNLDVFRKAALDAQRWLRELGLNQDQAAKLGVDATRQLNELFFKLGIMWDKLAVELIPVLNTGLRELNGFLEAHFGDIKNFLETTIREFATWAADPKSWQNLRQNAEQLTASLISLGDSLKMIIDGLKWIGEHPQIVGAVAGAVGGGMVGGVPGAIVGATVGAAAASPGLHNVDAEIARQQKEGQSYDMGSSAIGQLLGGFRRWITGQTHSPNVEIYEARGVWAKLKDWLYGSSAVVPKVRLDQPGSTLGGAGAAGGAGGLPGGGSGSTGPAGGAGAPAGAGDDQAAAAAPEGRKPAGTAAGASPTLGNQYGGKGSEFLKNQRARMAQEIKNSPGLQDEILGMALTEDARDPEGPIEALFNRAAYTGKSLHQLLHSGFYGPIKHGMLPGAIARLNRDAKSRQRMQAGLDAVIGGMNRLKGATDQGMAGDPNANQQSGRIFPVGGTRGAVYADWGGGPGGVRGAARFRQEQQRHVLEGGDVETAGNATGPFATQSLTIAPDSLQTQPPGLVPGGAVSNAIHAPQNTTIHVYGGDANTGQFVVNAQNRVNGDMVRNLTSALN